MLGPYGGRIECADGGTREQADSAIVALHGSGAELELEADGASADVIWLRALSDALDYSADLSLLPSETSLPALSATARALARLHAAGRAHGDLRPQMIRAAERTTALIVPAFAVDAPAMLKARLLAGERPVEVAFAAPEVAHGQQASPASDVYSLAAIVFSELAGRAPLGAWDASTLSALGPESLSVVRAALSPDPRQRPSAAVLAEALASSAASSRPNAPEVGSGSLLAVVLSVGAVAVFTGMLALALARWSEVSELARLALVAAFTLASFGAGRWLTLRGSSRSGLGLIALGAQLLWANTWLVLSLLAAERSYAAWALAGACVGVLQCLLATRVRSRLLGAFGALAFAVTAITLGMVLPLHADPGPRYYAAVVGAANALLAFGSARLGHRALAAPFAIAAAVWLGLSGIVASIALEQGLEPVALAWPYALALLCAWLAPSAGAPLERVANVTAAGLLFVSPSLQALIALDGASVAHVAALATLAIAALSARRLGVAHAGPAAAFAVLAVVWTGISAVASFWALSAGLLALAVPYLLAALHYAAARAARRRGLERAARTHQATLLGLLLIAPSTQALLLRGQPLVSWSIAGLGLALLARSRCLPVTAVGLAAALVTPVFNALGACLGREQLSWREGQSQLALALAVALGLSLLALVRARSLGRDQRRLLELGAAVAGPGLLLVLSLPVASTDFGYAGALLVSGGALLALALFARRLVLGAASATTLFIGLSVQYFVKLSQTLHWGLCAVGFGVVLLGIAVAWERRLRPLLPAAERWQ